jgi:C4-dicarboxylate transporter, DctM subunit
MRSTFLVPPIYWPLPLFVLMGEFLFRTKLSAALFSGLAPWAGLLPGQLLHVKRHWLLDFRGDFGIVGRHNPSCRPNDAQGTAEARYSPAIAIGSLAGAGTLGFLIPPSTVMIMYGVLAEESVLRLFTAGFLPGVLLASVFRLWT